MDIVNSAKRSEMMSRIKGRNTGPEMLVRRSAHALGFRFRLHSKELPGKPDIVFPKLRTAIFVHGCFWHRHQNCPNCTTPKTRPEFWQKKFASNVERDQRVTEALRSLGWRVFTIWECETKNAPALTQRLRRILGYGEEK